MMFSRFSFFGRGVLTLAVLGAGLGAARASDPFTKPTKEELSMTEVPGYPGAAAMVLFREQITKDELRLTERYERIKVLSEKGKELANVELPYITGGDLGRDLTDISGRTIHADGTIIPFTGKPYLKTMAKKDGMKYQARVFTLPDVEIGSIIEYRYDTRNDDAYVVSPDWYIQGPLYVKAAHYEWFPTTRDLMGRSGPVNSITWFPVLPAGAKIEHRDMPGSAANGNVQQVYELRVKDIPPAPVEEFMPPVKSLTYRVMFNFSEYRSSAEYWKSEGKELFKSVDSFANANSDLRKATDEAIAGASTPDEKLHRIYALTQSFENTDYTRSRRSAEEKAAGLGKVSNASDVVQRKRGSSREIAEVFLGMARAAGFKAYAMWVPDRSYHLFTPQWLNTNLQFDELLAIVMVDGKEIYFDPGERYCPYGHIGWQHSSVNGLREVEGGTAITPTPDEPWVANRTTRVANVTMDANGVVEGKLVLTYTGAQAIAWRQRALRGDIQSVRRALRVSLERMVPRSLQVKAPGIENLTEYEKPLVVTYDVKGPIGVATGKRLVVGSDLFTTNDIALFPHEKRDMPVYFHYAQQVVDAQRIVLPPTMSVEAVPDAGSTLFMKRGQYSLKVEGTEKWVTTRRSFTFGEVLVMQPDFPALRTFYSSLQAKDKEQVVLKAASAIDVPAVTIKEEKPKADADEGGSDDDEDDDNSGN